MKAKTKFMKMYYKLPEIARKELYILYALVPFSLNVCKHEIEHNTQMGILMLKQLGYEDD